MKKRQVTEMFAAQRRQSWKVEADAAKKNIASAQRSGPEAGSSASSSAATRGGSLNRITEEFDA